MKCYASDKFMVAHSMLYFWGQFRFLRSIDPYSKELFSPIETYTGCSSTISV